MHYPCAQPGGPNTQLACPFSQAITCAALTRIYVPEFLH
jgi:hypothetical protein